MIQELLRQVSFDPGSRLGSCQMSNYSSQLLGCIHTRLPWEISQVLWLAGRRQEHFGALLLREETPRSALGPAC